MCQNVFAYSLGGMQKQLRAPGKPVDHLQVVVYARQVFKPGGNVPVATSTCQTYLWGMAEEAKATGGYSWVNEQEMAERRKTDRPAPPGADPLMSQLLAEVASLRAEVQELRARPTAPPSRGVSREEASQIGAQFWTIIDQAKGEKQIKPVEVRPGFKDSEGDGNIAYRVFRTDEDIKKGGEVYRRPDELFHTQEDAARVAYPRRMSGATTRITGKKDP